MWFVFDDYLANWWIGFGVVVVVLLWFFVKGVIGRRVDGYEYCRGCGFVGLSGFCWGRARCWAGPTDGCLGVIFCGVLGVGLWLGW